MSHVGPGTEPVHHDVDPVPREARGIQGLRAGIVTRTAANTVDFAVGGVRPDGRLRGLVRHPLPDPPGPLQRAEPAARRRPDLRRCGAVRLLHRVLGDDRAHLRRPPAGASRGRRRGERLRWRSAAARAALCVVFPIGLYWSVVSATSRSVQDTLLRTAVVYDWAAGVPRAPAEVIHAG